MALKRKAGSNDKPDNPQRADLDPSAEKSETAGSKPANFESRSMQAGKRQVGKSAAGRSDNDSARDPDRHPLGSIEAIDEGDADGGVLGADEAESRGNDDPTRARSADVRDNPRGSPGKPGGRY